MAVRRFFSLLILGFIAFLVAFKNSNEIKPASIFHQMYDSIRNIKTLRQKVTAIERIDNKYSTNRSEVKIQTHPRKVYYHNPGKKLEVLFNSEINPQKAWVKPHVFPYLTIMLDPMGNLMRKNQHYSLHELGYDFIGKSIALTIKKDNEGLNNFTYKGKVMKNGYNCYFVEYENKSYNYTDYVVKEKETATLIAYKLCVNEYLLREKNDLLNDFAYLKKGRVLKVPTLYCQKAILYIDDKLCLPVALSMYDEHGLFESYEYTEIRINKPIDASEFTTNFKEYNF